MPPFERPEQRIPRLLSDYAHCIDDERYNEWPNFFTDHCLYQITTRDSIKRGMVTGLVHCESKGMLIDRINSLHHANIYEPHIYRHLLGPTRIVDRTAAGDDTDGGAIAARTGFGIIRVMNNGASDFFLSGLYDDEIVETEGMLKFRRRIVILDSSRVDALIVIPV